ncbi:rhamnosyltransferase WsaF family glycosyltransferase [Ramlibacter albus]|uniref:Uncharacterized protein n=1 Tax=Ramlibacter albus TaxID=2079448 RepID=A0A923M8C4_9BURK|nr:hypothetical protein [Ramlibacter albus]MBC5764758.1 hypothetical protein [Ramlibacter albus]
MQKKSFIQRVLRYRDRHGTKQLFKQAWLHIWLPVRARWNRFAFRFQRIRPQKEPMQYVRDATVELLLKVLGPGYKVVEPIQLTRNAKGVRANEVVEHRFRNLTPIRFFPVPPTPGGRINIVTDSINPGSLFGGVATSVIMGLLAAQDTGRRLRIITRTEAPHPDGLDAVLGAYGIAVSGDLELSYAPIDGEEPGHIEAAPDELFITTSWWTTTAVLATVDARQVVYLLQEDERMFYAHGDELLRCERLLRTPDVRFVVNSKLLFDHLVASGLDNVAARGTWFEPAFPPQVFHPRPRSGEKQVLMFYARPFNARNLFTLGLEVLEAAVVRGVIDPAKWDVVLVGKDLLPVLLGDGTCVPTRLENLDWRAYAELVGKVDLALSLMYTPHPSYPPFDLAASGAVVVTNTYGNKQDLSGYSRNILCAAPEVDALLAALAEGVKLAGDLERRRANHAANHLPADWRDAYAQVQDAFRAG